MPRRVGFLLLVAGLVLALSSANAAGRPFTYQMSGTMATHPTGCDTETCPVQYLGSGSLSCGEVCSTAPKPGGTFTFDGRVSTSPHRLIHPPNPCAGKGSATVTVAWSDTTTSTINFSRLHFPPGPCFTNPLFPPTPCRIHGTGTVTSGALLGDRVGLTISVPPEPCRTGSSFNFTGTMKFYPPGPPT